MSQVCPQLDRKILYTQYPGLGSQIPMCILMSSVAGYNKYGGALLIAVMLAEIQYTLLYINFGNWILHLNTCTPCKKHSEKNL